MKPGVTGLAQVRAGYAAGAREKLRFDLLYARNASVFLDISLLCQTLVVLLDPNAAEGVRETESLVDLVGLESETAKRGSDARALDLNESAHQLTRPTTGQTTTGH